MPAAVAEPPAAPLPPTAAPEPSPFKAPTETMEASMGDLDRIVADPSKRGSKPAAKADTKPDAQKPPAKAAEPPPEKSDTEKAESELDAMGEEQEKPAEKQDKPEPQKPEDKKPPSKAAELRTAYENLKAEHKKLKAEFESVKTAKPPEDPEKKTLAERIAQFEKRNQELEDEIRFVNYSKSKEFVEKFKQPFEDAWKKAISEIEELNVAILDKETGETSQRRATVNDLVALSNMPLGQARKTAKEWFGDASDDVMSHRRTLRELSDAQNKALEEARTKGGERDKQRAEEQTRQATQIGAEISSLWSRFNTEAQEKHEFLKPVEGDDERNVKLQKAIAFVEAAFNGNAADPSLKQDQRAEIIKRHVALRNRAIAYSVLRHENTKLNARVKELEEQLSAYDESEPGDGDGKGKSKAGAPVDFMDAAMSALAKEAV